MCGVPVERADEYLHRLIALGHRVAVCEQLEDPAEAKKRGPKSVVRRDVIRLVTPGTLTEDTLLDAKRNNYLLAVARARTSSSGDDNRFALAWIDISTGEFHITECDRASLAAELESAGVRVNSVNPGATRTDMRAEAYPEEDPQSLPTPEEITEIFVHLASDESRSVTGQTFEARDYLKARK